MLSFETKKVFFFWCKPLFNVWHIYSPHSVAQEKQSLKEKKKINA